MRRVIAFGLLLAVVAAAVESTLPGSRLTAQEPTGATVRLGARAIGTGSIAVGLQYRANDGWRFLTPTRNILPRSASTDRWHTTSAVEVDVVQAKVEIGLLNRRWSADAGPEQFTVAFGDARYRARCGRLILSLKESGLEMQTGSRDCEDIITVEPPELADPTGVGAQVLRVAARRLSAGGIELGAQRLVDGQWEALRQPDRPVLTELSRSVWRYTSALQLPALPGHVFGELRHGASITTRDGEFEFEVDGRLYRTRCGVLDLDILAEHILVDTATQWCHGSDPLLTICPTSDCDVQQNAAYGWESRQVGLSLDQVDVSRSEAQAVTNALFADYLPRARPPTVSFSNEQSHGHAGRSEIVLGTDVRTLGAVVHEVAHAIVNHAWVRDPGHGGAFTAMLLSLWERYFPIVDVDAARDDADRHGIEIASSPPVRASTSDARGLIGRLFCDQTQGNRWSSLCRAVSGEMSEQADAELTGMYIGWGANGRISWYAVAESERGGVQSFLTVASDEEHDGQPIGRLMMYCSPDQDLSIAIQWLHAARISANVTYRFDSGKWVGERWVVQQRSDGPAHLVPAADSFSQLLHWRASVHTVWQVRDALGGLFRSASFDLTGAFRTPVQANLAQCGMNNVAGEPGAPVIDNGSLGDDLFWGVDEDEQPPQTYVVKDTNISGSSQQARLSVKCGDGGLAIDVYWEVDRDLDWTILYRIGNGQTQSEDWRSGWGSWGDTEYKWTGRDDARNLISQMAWAAQSGATFTVQAHESGNPARTYTATFDLDGLFDTPVQPNIARCGRDAD